MSRVKLAALKVGIGVLRAVYAVMKLFPTSKKHLFITKVSNEPTVDFTVLAAALNKRHPDHSIVMLCHTMENKVGYVFHMFRQMYHLATAEVVFLDRSCLLVHILHHKKSLQIIQLWHALGSMKKFGFAIEDTDEGQTHDLAQACHMHEGYTWILISSKAFIRDYEEGFHTDGSNVVEIPLPRVDLLLDPAYRTQQRARLLEEMPQLKGKRTILYCPTYRKHATCDTREKIEELIDCIDFDEWNFIYSPHPVEKNKIEDERIIKSSHSTFELLFVADAVISDYSSVIYEAGLLNLPVYLYAYDWGEYCKHRQHNIDLEHEVPVLFTDDPKRLVGALQDDDFDYKAYHAFIEENVHVPKNKTCCEAIIDLVDSAESKEGRVR